MSEFLNNEILSDITVSNPASGA